MIVVLDRTNVKKSRNDYCSKLRMRRKFYQLFAALSISSLVAVLLIARNPLFPVNSYDEVF